MDSESEIPSLTQRIEKILSHFDKLDGHRVQNPLDQAKLDIVEKKEQNIETIRKLLKREAYFIDEEKKWIKANRPQTRSSRSKSP